MSDWFPGPGWLFCPADRTDRYSKALDRADVVILDLEDAVAAESKQLARNGVRRLAADDQLDRERTVLRINGAATLDHVADLQLATDLGLSRVMLAKAEQPGQISDIPQEVIALVETPIGVENSGLLAAQANVVGLMWGADDLIAGLGGMSSRRADGLYRDVARYARSRVLVAAKAWERLALDAVFMDIPDLAALAAECEDAAAVGFDATAAIHPDQVQTIRQAYVPGSEHLAWAQRLLDFVGSDRRVTTFEGKMVDGPIFKQAERALALDRRV